MAKDAKLIFSFPSASAVAPALATTTAGVVTFSGNASTWQKGSSSALNVGGFTVYAPGADTIGTGGVTLTGNMGSEMYLNATLACSTNFANSPLVQIMVEAASDSGTGTAGTDWTPVSGAYQMAVGSTTANAPAKRINIRVVQSAKPWLRVVVLLLHGATAGTGAVTITNASLVLGRDGATING